MPEDLNLVILDAGLLNCLVNFSCSRRLRNPTNGGYFDRIHFVHSRNRTEFLDHLIGNLIVVPRKHEELRGIRL